MTTLHPTATTTDEAARWTPERIAAVRAQLQHQPGRITLNGRRIGTLRCTIADHHRHQLNGPAALLGLKVLAP
mgnify:CR=1 FL=1